MGLTSGFPHHGRRHPELPWGQEAKPQPCSLPRNSRKEEKEEAQRETLDYCGGRSPRRSRTCPGLVWSRGDADGGSIDTDAMTTLTSSLLRTGAAGKGAGRRSTGLWGWGLLPAPAPLQPHCPGRDRVTATLRATRGAGVSHPSHTRCTHRAKDSRVLEPVCSSFCSFLSLLFLAGWNQDLTVEAHNGATQLFSITGESSSLQVYF